MFGKLAHFLAIAVEVSLVVGLLVAAQCTIGSALKEIEN